MSCAHGHVLCAQWAPHSEHVRTEGTTRHTGDKRAPSRKPKQETNADVRLWLASLGHETRDIAWQAHDEDGRLSKCFMSADMEVSSGVFTSPDELMMKMKSHDQQTWNTWSGAIAHCPLPMASPAPVFSLSLRSRITTLTCHDIHATFTLLGCSGCRVQVFRLILNPEPV